MEFFIFILHLKKSPFVVTTSVTLNKAPVVEQQLNFWWMYWAFFPVYRQYVRFNIIISFVQKMEIHSNLELNVVRHIQSKIVPRWDEPNLFVPVSKNGSILFEGRNREYPRTPISWLCSKLNQWFSHLRKTWSPTTEEKYYFRTEKKNSFGYLIYSNHHGWMIQKANAIISDIMYSSWCKFDVLSGLNVGWFRIKVVNRCFDKFESHASIIDDQL